MRNNASITGHRRAAYYGALRSYLPTMISNELELYVYPHQVSEKKKGLASSYEVRDETIRATFRAASRP